MFTKENDWVLDPFVGSGTTLEVAKKLRRNSIGIDVVPEYIEMIKSNIQEKEYVLFEPKTEYKTLKNS